MQNKELTSLKRLERISKVIEYCLDGMMNDPLLQFSHHVIRYNRWMEEFDYIIKNNLTMDTSNLNVSDFMRGIICHRIGMHTTENIDFLYKKKRKLFVD
jgi:hypothetical protein